MVVLAQPLLVTWESFRRWLRSIIGAIKDTIQGPEQDLKPEISQDTENQLIDQAIDLMYSRFPEIIKNKEIKRHMLQLLVGQITQGELKDKIEMEKFIKRLKKRTGVETV